MRLGLRIVGRLAAALAIIVSLPALAANPPSKSFLYSSSTSLRGSDTVNLYGIVLGESGAIPTGNVTFLDSPATVGVEALVQENTTFESIAVSNGHVCAVMSDTTVRCWGSNFYGQLGIDSPVSRLPVMAVVKGLTGVAEVAVGSDHSCARKTNNTVVCWGDNANGQLGIDVATTRSNIPVAVPGITNASAIAVGPQRSCAIVTDGEVKCWGYNGPDKLLGNTAVTATSSSTPVFVSSLTDASKLVIGGRHSCALVGASGSQTAQCWGDNNAGQLGSGDYMDSVAPQAITLPVEPLDIAVGYEFTCVITDINSNSTSGGVECWGAGTDGQLGNGDSNNSPTPVTVGGITNATKVVAGDVHACALTGGGSVTCWGGNNDGQHGKGDTVSTNNPESSFFPAASKVAAGGSETCSIDSNGEAYCAGFNFGGQIGNGTETNDGVSSPARVERAIGRAELLGETLTLGYHDLTLSYPAGGGLQASTSSTLNIIVTTQTQTIAFDPIADITYGDTVDPLSATAGSGLTVTFTSDTPAVCTVSGVTVTVVKAGTCTIAANQGGDNDYDPAPEVTESFTIAKLGQRISFATIADRKANAPDFTIAATSDSGLTVAFASQTSTVCTVSGTTVSIAAAGSCTIRASQAGNDNYESAREVDQSFTVSPAEKQDQTITFKPFSVPSNWLSMKSILTVFSSSGLAVSVSASPSNVCRLSGADLAYVGVGKCTVVASQAGNDTYKAAVSVTKTVEVEPISYTPDVDLPAEIEATDSIGLSLRAPNGIKYKVSVEGLVKGVPKDVCGIERQAGGFDYVITPKRFGNCIVTVSEAKASNKDYDVQTVTKTIRIKRPDWKLATPEADDNSFYDNETFEIRVKATEEQREYYDSFDLYDGDDYISGLEFDETGVARVNVMLQADTTYEVYLLAQRSFDDGSDESLRSDIMDLNILNSQGYPAGPINGESLQPTSATLSNLGFSPYESFIFTLTGEGASPGSIADCTDCTPSAAASTEIVEQTIRLKDSKVIGEGELVNQMTRGAQSQPSVAQQRDGTKLTTWTSKVGSEIDVRGRLEAKSGRDGTEFAVNAATVGAQGNSDAVPIGKKAFAVAYQSAPDEATSAILFRTVSTKGVLGPEIRLDSNLFGLSTDPELAPTKSGGAVATWVERSSARDKGTIKLTVIDAKGKPLGKVLTIASNTKDYLFPPVVAALSDGNAVVVWRTGTSVKDKAGALFGQIVKIKGKSLRLKGKPFAIDAADAGKQSQPSVTGLPGGGFVLAWVTSAKGGSDVLASQFDNGGAAMTEPFTVGLKSKNLQTNPVVATIGKLEYFIAWYTTAFSKKGGIDYARYVAVAP